MGNIAIIAAAGAGSRMKVNTKKQYLKLAGQHMLTRTVLLFQKNNNIDGIYLIVPKEDISFCNNTILKGYNFSKVTELISGGETRFESVF